MLEDVVGKGNVKLFIREGHPSGVAAASLVEMRVAGHFRRDIHHHEPANLRAHLMLITSPGTGPHIENLKFGREPGLDILRNWAVPSSQPGREE